MPTADTIATRFRDALGDDAGHTGDLAARWSCGGTVPQCVVEPDTVEATAAAIGIGREHGLAMIPVGNGTTLQVGWPPRGFDVALSTRRMHRLIDHNAADMTITLQAGVTLAALDTMLARAEQWLPLDPPRPDTMTVGGLIAADRNGPQRLAYGRVRDYLIGVQVVMADGSIVRGGGRVVKNVAGYDLPKLLIGSYGTLGVIAEATFKVRPRPAERRTYVSPAASLAEAAQRALQLLDGPGVTFVEVVNAAAARSCGCASGPAVIVGCAGSRSVVEECTMHLLQRSDWAVRPCEQPEGDAMYCALRSFPEAANDQMLVARISLLPAALASLLDRLETEAATRSIVVEVAAHAGNGIAWCRAHGPEDTLAIGLFAEWLRQAVRAAQGWVVFEYVPSALRMQVDPWGFTERSLPIMMRIKRALDPQCVFSPGRFVGRI